MKLGLNHISAEALREFSQSMPYAVQSIRDSHDNLKRVYDMVANTVGHEEDFRIMLDMITKAQEESVIAIESLSPALRRTADNIDSYLAKMSG